MEKKSFLINPFRSAIYKYCHQHHFTIAFLSEHLFEDKDKLSNIISSYPHNHFTQESKLEIAYIAKKLGDSFLKMLNAEIDAVNNNQPCWIDKVNYRTVISNLKGHVFYYQNGAYKNVKLRNLSNEIRVIRQELNDKINEYNSIL